MSIANIGSVGVTVVPDARNFARDLRAHLLPEADKLGIDVGRRIADGIKLELAKIHDVNVKVDLNTGEAETKIAALDASTASLGAAAASAGSGISAMAVGIGALVVAAVPLAAALAPIVAVAGAAGAGLAAFGLVAVSATGGLRDNAALAELGKDLHAVADALAPIVQPVIGAGIRAIAAGFQLLAPIVRAVSPPLLAVANSLTAAFSSPAAAAFAASLGSVAGPAISSLASILGSLASGIGSMIVALGPLGNSALASFAKFVSGFANIGQSAGFQKFLAYIVANGPGVVAFLKETATTIGNLIVAAAPIGTIVLQDITATFKVFNALPDPIRQGAVAIGLFGAAALIAAPKIAALFAAAGAAGGAAAAGEGAAAGGLLKGVGGLAVGSLFVNQQHTGLPVEIEDPLLASVAKRKGVGAAETAFARYAAAVGATGPAVGALLASMPKLNAIIGTGGGEFGAAAVQVHTLSDHLKDVVPTAKAAAAAVINAALATVNASIAETNRKAAAHLADSVAVADILKLNSAHHATTAQLDAAKKAALDAALANGDYRGELKKLEDKTSPKSPLHKYLDGLITQLDDVARSREIDFAFKFNGITGFKAFLSDAQTKGILVQPPSISIPGGATGGLFSGPGTGTSDSLLARVSSGEFLSTAESTGKHLAQLAAWNAGYDAQGAGGAKLAENLTLQSIDPQLLMGLLSTEQRKRDLLYPVG